MNRATLTTTILILSIISTAPPALADDCPEGDDNCPACEHDPARCGGLCYPNSSCCQQDLRGCNCDAGSPTCDWQGPCEPGDTTGGDGYTCVCDENGQCVWNDNCPVHEADGSCDPGDGTNETCRYGVLITARTDPNLGAPEPPHELVCI